MTNWGTDSLALTRSGAVARKKARLATDAAHEELMQTASKAVVKGLSEIQDGGPAPEILDDWEDEPGDQLNLLDDVGLDYEQLRRLISTIAPKPRRKGREWSTRMSRLHAQWNEQLDSLSKLYLRIKINNLSCTPSHYPEPRQGSNWFEIQCIDIFNGHSIEYIPWDEIDNRVHALLRAGYLPPTPTDPQVAFSLRTLELLYSLFRVASNFSIQSFARLLTDMHKTVFQPHLRTQVSLAFDIYYRILDRLRGIVQQQLGYNLPDYRLRHSCPACHHKVENEPERPIQFIVTGDGNTSLSRLRHHFEGILVHFAQKHSQRGTSSQKTEEPLISDACLAWKNARPMPSKSRSGALQVMDETGIFSVVCRHGIVQFLIDMVQSGELAKYPLASAEKLIRTFGKNILFVYDIGCTFSVTLSKSSIGDLAKAANFRCCTGSFHGAAHDRSCQLDFLISLQKGTGIEDGEGNERVYSESNALAPIIRHASPYYRHLRIHLHFSKWDEIKYEKLGDFLLSNFKSADRIIRDSKKTLDATQELFSDFDPDQDCPRWLSEERDYIFSLQSEPDDEKVKIEYLEAIEYLERAEATVHYWVMQAATPAGVVAYFGQHLAQANETLEAARSSVLAIEARSSLTLPWALDSPQRHEAVVLRQQRDYHQVLDELEQRAISRQLELEKIGLPKTDYKARQQISALVAKRGKSLQSILEKYNNMAASMNPPKPSLTWQDVTDLNFLSDIVLLRGREDIRDKPWFQHHFREATRAWHKFQRAREEIEIVSIEAHRIWAFMDEEEARLHQNIETIKPTDPELSRYIALLFEYRLRANRHLRSKLRLLEKQGGTCTPLPAPRIVGSPVSTADTGQADVSTPDPGTAPDPNLDSPGPSERTPNNGQDPTMGNGLQDTVVEQIYPDADWEDENEDADGDNHDYHHVIGRIVNALEAMDVGSV
ncbi:uncharacterized protein EI90DRAFT_3138775 [Cantharellus anzutake]|uniref:uncharacterized protein n=1 Tax=Cantharellus anzutake TaxID=1750568 RepID=UPI00190447DD|nr:uncharacterized protein EI90DRAFT_3138775 [Cantharellus anzutake]KAF8311110.1 hypothetical protein EI90DRAFT_3138775 [Cantharellus anzutake]